MSASCVHHVQLAVRNGSQYVHKLISNVNFELFAKRNDPQRTDWVLRSGSAVLVVSEHRDEILPDRPGPITLNDRCQSAEAAGIASSESNLTSEIRHRLGYISPPLSKQNLDFIIPKHAVGNIDTVCNVAFEVCDVKETVERAEKGGAEVLCKPTKIKDSFGCVTIAAVKSCVGNVVHTMLNTDHYDGVFLPGFSAAQSEEYLCNGDSNKTKDYVDLQLLNENKCIINGNKSEVDITVTHFDHVTFAIPTGASNEVLDWYERCFGMRRFWLDRNEDKLEGFVVRGNNVGLRMKAMEYWRCAETGLTFPDKSDRGRESKRQETAQSSNVIFVVAEALPNQGSNQVETFLEQHDGSGIQHIGLYTPNIEHAVNLMRNRGLELMIPPATYYTQIGKLDEMKQVGRDPEVLHKLGILVDAEDFKDEDGCHGDHQEKDSQDVRYLMQVFTRPFFDRDTFFLELIQRHGASGFGAGNIKALWRSVEAYMAGKADNEPKTKCLEY